MKKEKEVAVQKVVQLYNELFKENATAKQMFKKISNMKTTVKKKFNLNATGKKMYTSHGKNASWTSSIANKAYFQQKF